MPEMIFNCDLADGSAPALMSAANLSEAYSMIDNLFSRQLGMLPARLAEIGLHFGREFEDMQHVVGLGFNFTYVDEVTGEAYMAIHKSDSVRGSSTVFQGRPLGLVTDSANFYRYVSLQYPEHGSCCVSTRIDSCSGDYTIIALRIN